MAKKDFPWIRRQWIKMACRLEYAASRHFLTASVFGVWQRRLLRRYESTLYGEFPKNIKTAVVFLSCDEEYFDKFGIHLVRSSLKNASDLNVHLHVNRLSRHYHEKLKQFSETEGRGLFSYTWDDVEFEHLNGAQRWYYLASVRFVRLYQLVSQCDVPVLSVDADGVIVKSLEPKLRELDGKDAGIYLRLTNTLDWRKVLASALFVMPTKTGRDYIRDVALMIAWLLRGKLPYHIDQLVIYYMWQRYENADAGLRCVTLSQDMADWECRDDSYIWSAKGDRKYLDTAFRRAQET